MKLAHRVRHASSRLLGLPSKHSQDRRIKNIFTSFANKRKLLYFEAFDTSDNDAHVVRGMTLGLSSQDTNCMIGTHDGYDVVSVYRQDKMAPDHFWTIMAFDLHTAVNLPHMLIGRKSEVKPLFDSQLGIHRDLQLYDFEAPGNHAKKFIKHFSVYAPPAYAPIVEHVISPELTNAVVDRLANIVIEIEADTVYLVVDRAALSEDYLDTLLHYGVLFAKHIDEQMGSD